MLAHPPSASPIGLKLEGSLFLMGNCSSVENSKRRGKGTNSKGQKATPCLGRTDSSRRKELRKPESKKKSQSDKKLRSSQMSATPSLDARSRRPTLKSSSLSRSSLLAVSTAVEDNSTGADNPFVVADDEALDRKLSLSSVDSAPNKAQPTIAPDVMGESTASLALARIEGPVEQKNDRQQQSYVTVEQLPSSPHIIPSVLGLSRREVARHITRQDCWIILDGKVYNVSALLNSHPGGVNAIFQLAGTDATTAFRAAHSEGSSAAFAGIEKYLVGNLAEQ